jgi:transposase InsO family protein
MLDTSPAAPGGGEVELMLVELSVMEQRYQAVLAVVQDGWKIVEVAQKLGVSRQSVHAWLVRYQQGGLAALADRSHRPNSCAHQIGPEVEAMICEMRRLHPGWGQRRIEFELAREGCDPMPSRSSIYRCLKRHSLIDLRRRRKSRDEFRRWERERPMQLWQMDVMGGVLLDDETELKVLTGVDDHSRFCVAAGLMRRATSRAVCEIFLASLRTHGVPDEILTDNGKVFTARFGPHGGEVMFDRICRENGIGHRLTAIRSPTTTGKIERFHQSLRKEFLADRTFPSVKAAQEALDAWVNDYNNERPHQALEMQTPATRFRSIPREKDPQAIVDSEDDTPGQWILRRVASNGIISVDNQIIGVGNGNKGLLVDVFVDRGVIQIWHKNHLLKTVARQRSGLVRKIRSDGLHVKDQAVLKGKASGEP